MNVIANDFVKRQDEDSRFSHFQGTWSQLVNLVKGEWESAKPGYRTGVMLIPVPTDNFYSSIVQLNEGDKLTGEFARRRDGERPRKTLTTARRTKLPAVQVDIVLYSSEVLAEDGDNQLPIEDGNWEIISINAASTRAETPINPMVLMHNHFGSDGGTQTNLTDSDFVEMLRHSFHFWSDKATCG